MLVTRTREILPYQKVPTSKINKRDQTRNVRPNFDSHRYNAANVALIQTISLRNDHDALNSGCNMTKSFRARHRSGTRLWRWKKCNGHVLKAQRHVKVTYLQLQSTSSVTSCLHLLLRNVQHHTEIFHI